MRKRALFVLALIAYIIINIVLMAIHYPIVWIITGKNVENTYGKIHFLERLR